MLGAKVAVTRLDTGHWMAEQNTIKKKNFSASWNWILDYSAQYEVHLVSNKGLREMVLTAGIAAVFTAQRSIRRKE